MFPLSLKQNDLAVKLTNLKLTDKINVLPAVISLDGKPENENRNIVYYHHRHHHHHRRRRRRHHHYYCLYQRLLVHRRRRCVTASLTLPPVFPNPRPPHPPT